MKATATGPLPNRMTTSGLPLTDFPISNFSTPALLPLTMLGVAVGDGLVGAVGGLVGAGAIVAGGTVGAGISVGGVTGAGAIVATTGTDVDDGDGGTAVGAINGVDTAGAWPVHAARNNETVPTDVPTNSRLVICMLAPVKDCSNRVPELAP